MSSDYTAERRTFGDHPSQFFDLYMPADPRGTIISIHGGYWRAKYGLDLNAPMAEHLASRGWLVANIEYRRVIEETINNTAGVWSEMSSDVLAAIDATPSAEGPTILLGHSAGGQLALWAAAQPSIDAQGVVALAPVTDLFLADGLELSNHATKELFGVTAAEQPDVYLTASPLHLLPTEVPQLVVHGQKDTDVPPEMAVEYVETAHLLKGDVTLESPSNVDHFHIIDPTHHVWRSIDQWVDQR